MWIRCTCEWAVRLNKSRWTHTIMYVQTNYVHVNTTAYSLSHMYTHSLSHMYAHVHINTTAYSISHMYVHSHMHVPMDTTAHPHVPLMWTRCYSTGWRRPARCLKLQNFFHKRTTNYRAPLRKMTYEDKAPCASTPPCSWFERTELFVFLCSCGYDSSFTCTARSHVHLFHMHSTFTSRACSRVNLIHMCSSVHHDSFLATGEGGEQCDSFTRVTWCVSYVQQDALIQVRMSLSYNESRDSLQHTVAHCNTLQHTTFFF